MLSVTAGSADVISFLGLGGLFVAHITGNLVLLAAYLVAACYAVAGLTSLALPAGLALLALAVSLGPVSSAAAPP